jgi:DNA-binding response OmpR family regulator
MGGTISVSSEVGKGATFAFKLGLKRALKGQLAERAVAEDEDMESLLEGKCILVAEDSKLNQQFVADVLTAKGCRLIPVETGSAAIQAMLAEPVDLVLMDVMMPELTGDEAIKQIRNDFLFPLNGVPIITFSGRASKEEQKRFIKIGATDILSKPFSAAALVAKIATVLSNAGKYDDAQVEQRVSNDISAEMVEIFKADVPDYLRGLLNALYTQNEKQFVFQAHKLQSAMWVMEFMDLYEILARLENETLSFTERLDLCGEVCAGVEQSLTAPPA